MEFNYRRDQFAYFLGFVAKNRKRQLQEALQLHVDEGYCFPNPRDAFECCPFNDNQKQILRAVHIFENSKHANLPGNLRSLIREFLFLVSDFEPPCCDDGRSFYCKTSHGDIYLECDRCDELYDLEGQSLNKVETQKMIKADFLDDFQENSASKWPYHLELRSLTSM